MRIVALSLILTLLVGCQTEPIPSSRVANKTDFGMTEKPTLWPTPVQNSVPESVEVLPESPARDARNKQVFIEDFRPGYRDPAFTPGKLCSKNDPDFKEFRYAERIPYCARHVSKTEKNIVAKHYKILQKDYKNYEFDHFIPLSIGGANSVENLWPQPRTKKNAEDKDKLELKVFQGMRDGTLTQAEAVKMIMEWQPKE